VITSRDNPAVKQIRLLQRRRKHRRKAGLFVVEGFKLLEEAVLCGSRIESVLVTEEAQERCAGLLSNLSDDVSVTMVSEQVLSSCSDAVTPQGILAVLSIPEQAVPEATSFVVVLDQIQDPGNMGTLLRTARAAGVEAVLLTEGTVDPYNPKVVRAGMGAQLALSIIEVECAELPGMLAGLKVWLADSGGGTPYDEVDWTRPAALVIGNEAHGSSPGVEKLSGGKVLIPMPGSAESLNAAVAGGVLMFEIVRQRKQ